MPGATSSPIYLPGRPSCSSAVVEPGIDLPSDRAALTPVSSTGFSPTGRRAE